ncbi:hypothetical protein TVAG_329450 [Trichomonas vaginalis G3]|uniref:Uncharacterized protein n=1 Tax=Trichomonas vaginalis (strain ATCC PRA-98 / G3) TaxID=412133 RepID=A2EBB3_TRIV3|nr:hypothetical protein TVAGG3_0309570 [Trichomonas vaginalis G3]EAY10058.1 hypothetical protein TVAG_329450 [Trichomonas vaginalis G3]KAI5528492.1 hypothetical protein TVAGG3_0309570 [Trichomonas vaginalis G3]|eukprot:XP_001322281.1 hypothetical protein [Trichomonas vaginalis G3]
MIEDENDIAYSTAIRSYYVFVYCPKPQSITLTYRQLENTTIYTQNLLENRIQLFNVVSETPLNGSVFQINVSVNHLLSHTHGQQINIRFDNNQTILYDASHYTGNKASNMLYYILPVLCTVSPQPVQHFQVCMTVLQEYSAYTSELAKYLNSSSLHLIKFLGQFENEESPSLIVGLFIISRLLKEVDVPYKVSKYLTTRLRNYLDHVYSDVIFTESYNLPTSYHHMVKSLYDFIKRSCGSAFAGFLIWSFCSPIIDIDTVSFLSPVSDIIADTDLRLANSDLINYLLKRCSKGQPVILTALFSSISPISTIKCRSKILKLSQQFTELDYKSVDVEQIAAILSHRLRLASIDYSSQNFFITIKPILDHFSNFPSLFNSIDHWMPFRHLPNFAIEFDIPREMVFDLAITGIENEENVSNLYISTLGNVLVLIEGEKWLLLFEEFFKRVKSIAFDIGLQLREQCQKTIWKAMSANSEEFSEITNRVFGPDVCALYAGYFSASAFLENDTISEALRQCLVSQLPNIDLSPRAIGKDYVNIVAIMRCEWALTVDPVSMKKIAKAALKLVRSIKKRVETISSTGIRRLACLEKCADHIIETLNMTFPHV